MQFKPMLAANTKGAIQFPVLASPKLDGVRCLIIDGKAMGRSLKPLPNKHLQSIFGKAELNGLDGELICGPVTGEDGFRKTTSAVMTIEGEPELTYWVFDMWNVDEGFATRHYQTKRMSEKYASLGIKIVPHKLVYNQEELDRLEQKWLKDGFEGVMIRDPRGPYKCGRSTAKEGYLLKIKRFADSEARILGVTELLHNDNEATTSPTGYVQRSSHKEGMKPAGVLGSLVVEDVKTKVVFDLGTGFTAEQRQEYWNNYESIIGKIVKYKYQESGVKDKPRFPVFLGFRHEVDMD